MLTRHRRWIVFAVALMAATLVSLLHDWEVRGPLYQGRDIADWVADALMENGLSKPASDVVLEIGTPAVPFIAKHGLHAPSHKNPWLAYDSVDAYCNKHPVLGGLALKLHVLKLHNCVSEHTQAWWLLSRIGTNAVVAVPDVIDCIEHCPNAHFITAQDLLDTLGTIGVNDPGALTYLTQLARQTNSLSLRAATYVYWRTGDTNLMMQTISDLGPRALGGMELSWLREDHALNQHIIPVLERMYHDPKLDALAQSSILSELESRGNDATAAIARLLARQTNAPRE